MAGLTPRTAIFDASHSGALPFGLTPIGMLHSVSASMMEMCETALNIEESGMSYDYVESFVFDLVREAEELLAAWKD